MRVFVYGTLLAGFGNHKALMQDATFLGKTTTKGKMYSAGGFPMVVRDDDERSIIHGEVYEVDDETARQLDRLEGHPRWYCREPVPTEHGEAWIYLMPAKSIRRDQPLVESGDWRQYVK